MFSLGLVRWGGIGWMLSGVAWVALGANGLNVLPHYPSSAVFLTAAVLLLLVGLVGLHSLQEASYGRMGWAGFRTAFIAFATQILGAAASLSLLGRGGFAFLGVTGAVVGALAAPVGFVLLGFATLQAGMLPRWYGVALVVALPVKDALVPPGNILFGLLCLILGYILWSRRGTQPISHQVGE